MLSDDVGFLFDPDNAVAVGAWGLILTVVGFAITIVQLARTQGALTAANTATQQMRKRIAAQNLAINAANADARLKTAQRELRAGDWQAALDALENLREILVLIYRRPDHLDSASRAQLEPFLRDLQDFCDYIDRRGPAGVSDAKRNAISRRLRGPGNLITNLADHLSEGTQ